jgi:hypothetical protein
MYGFAQLLSWIRAVRSGIHLVVELGAEVVQRSAAQGQCSSSVTRMIRITLRSRISLTDRHEGSCARCVLSRLIRQLNFEVSGALISRQLAISSVLYAMLVWLMFGATAWGLRYQPWLKVLPLHLKG